MSVAAAPSAPEALPQWDLSDLFAGPDDPALEAAFKTLERACSQFHATYASHVAKLDASGAGEAVVTFEGLQEQMGRIGSFSGLLYQENMEDEAVGRFYQAVSERLTDLSKSLIFFTLELAEVPDATFTGWMAGSQTLARYRPWLEQVRKFRPHQLSDEMERLVTEKGITGHSAWVRLFDETLAALRFDVDGEAKTLSDTLNQMSDPDGAKRKGAAMALGEGLQRHARLFTTITNVLAKDKAIDDDWRHYAKPVSFRNLANQVEDEVVDALVGAVRDAYPRLSHRYYALKAKWFGQDKLDYWDRNAPLPFEADRSFSWNEATELVLGAYGQFSPELAAVGKRFFDKPWIDAALRPGKASGAFAHPTVPSAHPYLLLNYHGKARDVMTLAHELGHGVHQILAGHQGYFLSDTPLTLAETASVFGEMLTFRALLDAESDPLKRKALLAAKVEDMLNTVVRQIAFFEFEAAVHDQRKQGELSAEVLGDLWMDVQTRSLGPALRFDEGYRAFWAYIPHFIHSPFYVYAYAFGDCLVNALYALYEKASDGFAARYLDLLRAGGTRHHSDLLAPFGLDARDPAFWQTGLEMIGQFIDQLEQDET